MSNFAALIDVLSVAGSRLSDGTANASGTVWFFQPGTNTAVNVYSDAAATTIVTQPITLTSGGLVNRSDLPGGIFVTQPVRLLVQDVSGNTVADTTYIPATAGDVGVNNAGFTDSTLDAVLTKAFTSTGGQDFQYLIATGQTPLNITNALTALAVNVKAFGALGDGIHIDTQNIQNALNYAKSLGGATVFFPNGNYIIDQALSLTSADGMSIVGSGATTITSTHATANVFTIDTCNGLRIQDIDVVNSSSSTGTAYALSTCDGVLLIRATSGNITDGGTYKFGLTLTTCTNVNMYACTYATTGANNRGMVFTGTTRLAMFGGNLSSTFVLEIGGASGLMGFYGVVMGAVNFLAGVSLTDFEFHGCISTSFTVATATIPGIRVFGGNPQASATSSATGASQTPSLIGGDEVILTASSGGAGTVTVNAPAVLPDTSTANANLYWDFVFKNAAGGAVTWTLNAVFVVTAAIPTTDAHTISVRFRWDRTTSKLREVSRADTVT